MSFGLISFEEPPHNDNFETPDTFFESNDLNDLDDISLDESAQPNIAPSDLFVKTPQHSNSQQSQLERESTSFHDTLEHNLDLNSDPPHSFCDLYLYIDLLSIHQRQTIYTIVVIIILFPAVISLILGRKASGRGGHLKLVASFN